MVNIILVKEVADIIEVDIPPEFLKYAIDHAHKGKMNKHTMLEGNKGDDRKIAALLSELVIHEFLPMLTYKPGDNYDFFMQTSSDLITVDIKNKAITGWVEKIPDLDWDCT